MSKLKTRAEALAKAVFDNQHVKTFMLGFSIFFAVVSFFTLCSVFPSFGALMLVLAFIAVLCVATYALGWVIRDIWGS